MSKEVSIRRDVQLYKQTEDQCGLQLYYSTKNISKLYKFCSVTQNKKIQKEDTRWFERNARVARILTFKVQSGLNQARIRRTSPFKLPADLKFREF